jgi:hypothetical protein
MPELVRVLWMIDAALRELFCVLPDCRDVSN